MCKLFSMSNCTKMTQKQVEDVLCLVSKNFEKTERDGLGVSMMLESGDVLVNRYLNNNEVSLLQTPKNVESMIIHGRTSTNDVSLLNTHPICRDGLILSHNGVVDDLSLDYETMTTNDTEYLVKRIAEGLSSVETNIVGYYAALYYKQGDKNLRVMRDNIASLHWAFVESIDSFIFSTRPELIFDVVEYLGTKIEDVFLFDSCTHAEVFRNEIVSLETFKPKGRSFKTDAFSVLSLGHALDALTVDEETFLAEIDFNADASWVFFKGKEEITLDKFFDLDDSEKFKCLVVRPDGTICSTDPRYDGLVFDYNYLVS